MRASPPCRWWSRCCTGRASTAARCGCAGWRWRSSSPPASPIFFDGYFARIWGQQSSLGRMLDPIADKLLVAVLPADAGGRRRPSAAGRCSPRSIILCREILVSGLREYLAELRVSVPVTRLAKWKTIGQMVAVGFLIAGEAGDRVAAGGDADRHRAAVALGDPDALHRLGLHARRPALCDRRMTD